MHRYDFTTTLDQMIRAVAEGSVELKSTSGHLRLDRAALESVQRWKFVPAKRDDKPVDAWVLVPIRFSLNK